MSTNLFYFQGGRHVDYITDQIVSKIIEIVKKKNKGGVNIKPFQVSVIFCLVLFVPLLQYNWKLVFCYLHISLLITHRVRYNKV